MKTQRELFDFIVAKEFKRKKDMYTSISDFLYVSEHTVSKWSYGTSVINYDYLSKIVKHFNIKPDEIFNTKSDFFCARYKPLNMRDVSEYREYIQSIDNLLFAASKSHNTKISFQADEIPIFHFMPYKKLTYFKLYVYAYDMSKLEISYEQYVKELDSYKLEPIYDSIALNYDKIESIEIWDNGIIDNLLAQIEYIDELERFENLTVR
ncbi:hypothetical protein [Sphingobacterium bovistauri]|uniref:HTH cro/C1-type domain-containing protein n=1 Tax=Sphingobacterium bovistauri TaxID=2781959 RepID=A0ABS7Z1M0_9SPHI|nr:hypothetical protein [Sphingobacterium bovistauri]MCA5004063.1 hypothetical protein [Sphingobacterium bovistauri]